MFDVAAVGVEVHLAVGQCADELAVFLFVGDVHDRGVALLQRRVSSEGGGERSEAFAESHLLLLFERLPRHQQDAVLVEQLAHRAQRLARHRLRQVKTPDFRPQSRRQRTHAETGVGLQDFCGGRRGGIHRGSPSAVEEVGQQAEEAL